MPEESSNQNNDQSKPTSTTESNRPKVNPDKTINYRQDGKNRYQKKG